MRSYHNFIKIRQFKIKLIFTINYLRKILAITCVYIVIIKILKLGVVVVLQFQKKKV